MDKAGSRHPMRLGYASTCNQINIYSAQCGECFKWRVIPKEAEYEEIRSKFTEDPFVCSKRPGMSCNDPTDIEYNNTRTWVIDKPDIPKPPPGFKRRIVMRKDYSKMDCYYNAPTGKRLRASTEVVKFLDTNPKYKQCASIKDFCFTTPKVMEDTVPPNLVKK